jgi:ubiquinone/menaquinone biosynthesis C-methylase UbiE
LQLLILGKDKTQSFSEYVEARELKTDDEQVAQIVKGWYGKTAKLQQLRLAQDPYHQIEFIVTMHFLEKYLPSAGVILDAGGGPGRYTIELAKKGYDIVLLDLTPELLSIAKKQIARAKVRPHVKKIMEGSIVDLSEFSNQTFDAVLCLGGPLNHLLNSVLRERAVGELARVAKKDSPVFISVISRLGLLTSILVQNPTEIQTCKHHLETGDYIPGLLPRRKVKGFTAAHWFLPEELHDLCTKHGIDVLEMASLEGLSSSFQRETNRLAKNKRNWKAWIEILLQTCTHPSIVGSGEHFLLVGRRSQ